MKSDKIGRKAPLHTTRVATPNDPKLSDGGGWRGPCMAGGKAAAEARAVTAVAVRCSAWLGDVGRVAIRRSVEDANALLDEGWQLLCIGGTVEDTYFILGVAPRLPSSGIPRCAAAAESEVAPLCSASQETPSRMPLPAE